MKLLTLRKKIDACDADLIALLAKRFSYTRKIGKIKAEQGLPAQDSARERIVLEQVEALAKKQHLNPAFVRDLFVLLMTQVREEHRTQ